MIVKDRFAFSTAAAGRKHSIGLASTTSIAPFPETGDYSAARARVAFVSHRRGPGRARRKVGPNGKRHLKRQFARVSRVQ